MHWLYASVPLLSMYMQEHPCSVCILSAFYSSPVTRDQCHCFAQCSSWIHPALPLHCPDLLRQGKHEALLSSKSTSFWNKIQMRFGAIEDILPSLQTSSSSAFAHTPDPYFFPPLTPPQARAGELLLSGRALWSLLHPGLSRTHTSHSLKPLKAHAPACSHGSLKRSGGEREREKKKEQSAVCSSLPFVCLHPSPHC